jgi:Cof subfamily protein (haloacid dehalogenase superfamily)
MIYRLGGDFLKYKIIASDMDGTLLNDDKHVCNYNLEMTEEAMKLGVKFVISSGRIPGGLKFYEATVCQKQPMICCNGAIILDHNKNVIFSKLIDKAAALKVVDVIREYKDTYFHFYDEDVIYSEYFGFATEKLYRFNKNIDKKFRTDIRIVADSREYIKNTKSDINKIVVIDEDLNYLEDLKRRIDDIPEIETTKSEMNNIEIVSSGVSKGNGLKFLAKYYGVPIDECIAIGNDENDISMIQCAGLGVAVSNAREHVKKVADFVTEKDNNEGAVGEVIEKFILNTYK